MTLGGRKLILVHFFPENSRLYPLDRLVLGVWFRRCDFSVVPFFWSFKHQRRKLIRRQYLTLGGRNLILVHFWPENSNFTPRPFFSRGKISPLWFFHLFSFLENWEWVAKAYPDAKWDFEWQTPDFSAFFTRKLEFLPPWPSFPRPKISTLRLFGSVRITDYWKWEAKAYLEARSHFWLQKAVLSEFLPGNSNSYPLDFNFLCLRFRFFDFLVPWISENIENERR